MAGVSGAPPADNAPSGMSGKRAIAGRAEGRSLLTNYVRAWRRHRGLTIEQLAERAGLSITTISEIERHRADFTGKTLREIAGALGTTPGSLISGPPSEINEIWTIWDDLGRQNRRPQAEAILRALRDSRG